MSRAAVVAAITAALSLVGCSETCGKGTGEDAAFVLLIPEHLEISAQEVLVVTAGGVELARGTAVELIDEQSIRGPNPATEATDFALFRETSRGLEVLGTGQATVVTSESAEGGVCRTSTDSRVEISSP